MSDFGELRIDNKPFRPPNKVAEDEISSDFVVKERMLDGSMHIDKIVTGSLFNYNFDFTHLHYWEYEQIKEVINNGIYQVNYYADHYKIDGEYYIEMSVVNFDFGAGRGAVKLKLENVNTPE